MKMKLNLMKGLLPGFFLAGGLMLVGCSTDDKIDVGELDKTIGIGAEDLNVPLGAAENVKLDDVLSLKEGDVIETLQKDSASYKKGDYQFKKGDDLDPANVKVNEVHFETFTPQEFSLSIPFASMAAAYIPSSKEYSFPIGGPQKINAFDVVGNGNDDVVALSEADLDGSFVLNLGLSKLKNELNFTQIDLYLPRFLEFDLDYIENHHKTFIREGIAFKLAGEARDGGRALTQDEKDYNVLTLKQVATQNDDDLELKVKRVVDIKAEEPAASETEKGYMIFSKANGLKLHGVVKMQLRFTKGNMTTDGQSSTETRVVDPKISMLGNGMYVTHAEGIFDPKININPSTVNIGDDVPDFLTDDDVTITLNNPTIKLVIQNNINARANLKPKMIAYTNDEKTEYKYMYLRGKLKSGDDLWPSISPNKSGNDNNSKTTWILISRNIEPDVVKLIPPGADFFGLNMNGKFKGYIEETTGKADPREVTDISELLSPHIPKSIEFEIEARVDQDTIAKVDLYDENDPNSKGGNYKITPSYEFIAPLALDPGSTIVYNDTIADWNKDIKDNDIDLDSGEIIFTGNVQNNTPLELTMIPVPIGLNKQEIKDIKVTSNIVVPSNLGSSDKTPIKIVLTRNEGGTFKNLDGLAFKVIAKSSNTATLNKDTQFINVTDLKLNLKGKLSISL